MDTKANWRNKAIISDSVNDAEVMIMMIMIMMIRDLLRKEAPFLKDLPASSMFVKVKTVLVILSHAAFISLASMV